MTTPTPADAIRAAAPLTAETIKPGPYSEHDLRELWNAQSDEEWYELMSYQQLAFAQTQAIEADRRRAEPAPARLRHCPTHGQQGPEAWGCPECLRELRAELATAREALRRLVDWGGSAASKGVNSEATIEPAPSVSALPPALVHDGGDGVRIWATGPERTDWVVRRDAGGYRERLHIDGRWWAEPWHWDFDEASLVSSHWLTAAAAWEALQRSRAAEGVEAQPAAPSS